MKEKTLTLQDKEAKISSFKILVFDTRNVNMAATLPHNTSKECEVNNKSPDVESCSTSDGIKMSFEEASHRLQHSHLKIIKVCTDHTRSTNAGNGDLSNITKAKWRTCFSNLLKHLLCLLKRDQGSNSYVCSPSRRHHIVNQLTHMSSTDHAKALTMMICHGT